MRLHLRHRNWILQEALVFEGREHHLHYQNGTLHHEVEVLLTPLQEVLHRLDDIVFLCWGQRLVEVRVAAESDVSLQEAEVLHLKVLLDLWFQPNRNV